MDSDSELGSHRLALIDAVRKLDEDETIPLTARIDQLESLISSNQDTRLHGLEEYILRWIFKHMSSTTEDAEQIRRYPITWSILARIFPQIPSQTLARSLASLRFVTVLRQTVRDITTARKEPTEQGNGVAPANSNKRKRKSPDTFTSDINELRTPKGCIQSATEVFGALHSLIESHLAETDALEQKVGAEPIKTLFSSSNDETREIAAGLLLTCDRSLSVLEGGLSHTQDSWVETITTLWDLHLHNKDDGLEFARHIFVSSCSILTRLRGCIGVAPVSVESDGTKSRWVLQLEQFLNTYCIRPARHQFSTDESLQVLETAFAASTRNQSGSALVTWDIVVKTPMDSSNPKSKAEHLSWVENVFKIVLDFLQPLDPLARNKVIIQLLEAAIQATSIPGTEILRTVYREHAFTPNQTDWNLVSKLIACDADVFLMADEMTQDILDKVGSYAAADTTERELIVTEIILPLVDAFAKARNLSGFIREWHERLCRCNQNTLGRSIWFDAKIRNHLASILQSSLTSTQLLRTLEDLATPDAPVEALLVVLDGVSAGITEDDFINDIDPKLFTTLFKDRSYAGIPSSIRLLRWRIAGRMVSWETADEADRLWIQLKPILEPILKKCDTNDHETLEAVLCLQAFSRANYPQGPNEAEVREIMEPVESRLELMANGHKGLSPVRPYLDSARGHLLRAAVLLGGEASNPLIGLYQNAIVTGSVELDESFKSLLRDPDFKDNENMVNALISSYLSALDSAETRSGWTVPQSLSLISLLLEFPRESWTKPRRKSIMSSWKKWRSAIATRASQDSQYATAVLRLLVEVMQQPTFYEGMTFEDLIYIASMKVSADERILALIEKLFDLTLKQMIVAVDRPHLEYLDDALRFMDRLEPNPSELTLSRRVLVNSLTAALIEASRNEQPYPAVYLAKIEDAIDRFVEMKLFSIPSTVEGSGRDTTNRALELSIQRARSVAPRAAQLVRKAARPGDRTKVKEIEDLYASCASENVNTRWQWFTVLLKMERGKYDMKALLAELSKAPETIDEELVFKAVDAFITANGNASRQQLLDKLVGNGKASTGPIGPLLAIQHIVESYQGPTGSGGISSTEVDEDPPDFAIAHLHLAAYLDRAKSLRRFKQVTDILALLHTKHSSSMAQVNIDATLEAIAIVCSPEGPEIAGTRAAGEIYNKLCMLVAVVLKQDRRKTAKRYQVLATALQRLLGVLLINPTNPATANAAYPRRLPGWVTTPLRPRHAERWTRLVTLVCEPSAASVARARPSELASATDEARRAAGQCMFVLLEDYVKLQLATTVPGVMKRALAPGIFAILDITPVETRTTLSEALDDDSRRLFRLMYADYRKFGQWSGV